MNTLPHSIHAHEQMTRRRIRAAEIELALRLGLESHAAGAIFYVLRLCDIPRDMLRDPSVRRAEGTTVVVEGGRITTVYRNRDVRHLRRKPKRSARPRLRSRVRSTPLGASPDRTPSRRTKEHP